MRQTVFAIGLAVMLLFTTAALAKGKKAGGTYTGCLAAGDESGEYKLTNVNGGSDEYELIGGKGLKDHVGHKVEIKGSPVSAAAAKHAEKSEKGENEAGHKHLRVASMKHVAATCP
jgi:hypothetical protein